MWRAPSPGTPLARIAPGPPPTNLRGPRIESLRGPSPSRHDELDTEAGGKPGRRRIRNQDGALLCFFVLWGAWRKWCLPCCSAVNSKCLRCVRYSFCFSSINSQSASPHSLEKTCSSQCNHGHIEPFFSHRPAFFFITPGTLPCQFRLPKLHPRVEVPSRPGQEPEGRGPISFRRWHGEAITFGLWPQTNLK